MIEGLQDPTLLGIAAIVSAIGGVASTVWALYKSRDEEEEKCREKLKVLRAESEACAEELHRLKMGEGNASE